MSVAPPSPEWAGPAANDSGGGNKPIKRIVMHSTVGPSHDGKRYDIAAWFRNPAAGGSAHYIVDAGGIVQTVWDSVIAWHAPPNSNSLGVELCDWPGHSESNKAPLSRWNRGDHAKILQQAARLTARLCLAYNVPIRKVGPVGLRAGRKGITGHVQVRAAWKQTSHWDPGHFPWRKFIRMCRAEAAKIQGRDTTPPPITPVPERDEFEMASLDDLRSIVRQEIDRSLDRRLNEHAAPKGNPITVNVTRGELEKAIALFLDSQPETRVFLEDARQSPAEK